MIAKLPELVRDLTDAWPLVLGAVGLVSWISRRQRAWAKRTIVAAFVAAVYGTPRTDHPGARLWLGDARTNGRDPGADVFAQVAARAGRTFWLNPEPKGQWGTGDSAAKVYNEVISMHECRSAKQLAAVIDQLLPV